MIRLISGTVAVLLALGITYAPSASATEELDSFNPGVTSVFGEFLRISDVVVQPDGKVIFGGQFRYVAGQERSNLARVNSDGSLDSAFNPGPAHPFQRFRGAVYALALQNDGKSIVAGSFSFPQNHIMRLNGDGTLDSSFNPNPNESVVAVTVQPDGKLIVGGGFSQVGGQPRQYIARINSDGSADTTFRPPTVDRSITTVAVQPDGKVVIGGDFFQVDGQSRRGVARLNSDGSWDESFNPGPNAGVSDIAVQPDGKVIIAGAFEYVSGQYRRGIARLMPDGSLDTTFNADEFGAVGAVSLQSNGKILLGGNFATVGGQNRNFIARVHATGLVDSSFSVRVDNSVEAFALQSDSKIILAGSFGYVDGKERSRIARVGGATLPGSPTGVTATPGDRQALVSWTAPASDGGSAITGYTVTAAPGGMTCTTAGTLTCAVTGLTNGTTYTFTVTATSAAGNSLPFTPSPPTTPLGVPGSIRDLRAISLKGAVRVSWSPPRSTGGAPSVSYEYRIGKRPWKYVTATSLTLQVRSGTMITITVRALNAAGRGVPARVTQGAR